MFNVQFKKKQLNAKKDVFAKNFFFYPDKCTLFVGTTSSISFYQSQALKLHEKQLELRRVAAKQHSKKLRARFFTKFIFLD